MDGKSGKIKIVKLLSQGSSLQHLLKAVENIYRLNYIPYRMVSRFLA